MKLAPIIGITLGIAIAEMYSFDELMGIFNFKKTDLFSTNKDPEIEISDPFRIDYSRYDEETNAYFKEIALKSEFNDEVKTEPYRWTENVKIHVQGNQKPQYMIDELIKIVKELNELIDPIHIYRVENPEEANCIIYLGSMQEFHNQYPEISLNRLKKNWGFFDVTSNNGVMYVDMFRTEDDIPAQKHLLREELTQMLGLFNDSPLYPESIFQSEWTTTTEYSEMDKRLIDMLYN